MVWAPGHSWAVDVPLKVGSAAIEYKIILTEGNACTWEPGANRKLLITASKSSRPTEVICSWGMPRTEVVDYSPWLRIMALLIPHCKNGSMFTYWKTLHVIQTEGC
jgi:hypothetical protein